MQCNRRKNNFCRKADGKVGQMSKQTLLTTNVKIPAFRYAVLAYIAGLSFAPHILSSSKNKQ